MYNTASSYMILIACVVFINVKNNLLTWNSGTLYKEANFHPCWAILVPLPSPTAPFFFLPIHTCKH